MTTPADGPQDATAITRALNRAVLDALPFADTQDFDDARRGFVASLPEIEIKNAQDRVVWSLRDYAFLEHAEAPPTVNPSLWRQARLNLHHGLYQVGERIYQVRGFDISNMTILEGERGLVVIDPLVSTETARAGLDLYVQHRGPRPVTAVIYTHSHVDHYGGVRGVIDEADVRAGRVAVIAPHRFMEEVVTENVLAGTPMVRRAQFQFGPTLPKGPRGQVDAGLGKVISRGTVTLIPPTQVIAQPLETHRVDGLEIVFQLAPETEAPAEMHMFYPGLRALNLAENATHNLHNIYPIRGAQVRDANAWAKYLNEALDRFGRDAGVDVVSDGEQGKVGYSTYVRHRLTGFGGRSIPGVRADWADFPKAAARSERRSTVERPTCDGPIEWKDRAAVGKDVANFRAAVTAAAPTDAFMTAASPGVIAHFLKNEHYATREAYLARLVDVMKEEYDAIHQAGFLVQVDCPDLAMSRHLAFPELSNAEFLKIAAANVEALNHALRDIPRDRIRLHLCWGNYEGPHHRDIPLREILPIVLRARPQAISLEGANPRHEHEWAVFREITLPDDRLIIPGVLDSTTNFIEHPELVAQRIVRYAEVVGRERVIAGSDCGFATFARSQAIVEPEIVWAKLAAMVEGARLPSAQLWGKR